MYQSNFTNHVIRPCDCRNEGKLAKMLKLYNDWRRGIGKYSWTNIPSENANPPFTPKELTMIINGAIRILKADAKCRVTFA